MINSGSTLSDILVDGIIAKKMLEVLSFGAEAVDLATRIRIQDNNTGRMAEVNPSQQLEVASNLVPLVSIGNGQKTIGTAGIAETLGSSTAINSVTIKALAGNTNNVYVGDSGVDSSNGFVLAAGEAISLDIDDLADVYLDVDTNNEGVSFIYLT